MGFSLVALSGDYSLLVCRLLIAAAPLIAEDRPQGARASVDVAQGLSSCSPQALEQANLLHSMWDLSGPGVEPVSPALAGRFFTTEPPGKPSLAFQCVRAHSRLSFTVLVSHSHCLLSLPLSLQ